MTMTTQQQQQRRHVVPIVDVRQQADTVLPGVAGVTDLDGCGEVVVDERYTTNTTPLCYIEHTLANSPTSTVYCLLLQLRQLKTSLYRSECRYRSSY